jgi:hypothetical protein
MKKLIVCGCSYSAPSSLPEYVGTSWSEVLAKKLGWNLENYARQGCSNGGIRIQIDEAIKQRPDFVIVTPTSYDRMEIPNNIASKTLLEFGKDITDQLMRFLLLRNNNDSYEYDKHVGLDNINYSHNASTSRLISETMFSLVENRGHQYRSKHPLPADVQKALEMYVNFLYDKNWKRQLDEWIIRDGLVQLKANNIPFLINPGYSFWADIAEMQHVLYNVLESIYIQEDKIKSPHGAYVMFPPHGHSPTQPYGPPGADPGYHTTPEGQTYLANHYYNIIKNRWSL